MNRNPEMREKPGNSRSDLFFHAMHDTILFRQSNGRKTDVLQAQGTVSIPEIEKYCKSNLYTITEGRLDR